MSTHRAFHSPALFLLLSATALSLGTFPAAADAKDIAWQFGMISDSQRGDDDNPGTDGVSVPMLSKIATDMKTHNVDLVICSGDLTEAVAFDTTRDNQRKQYRTWKATMSTFYNSGIGVYPVRGNHEGLAYGYDAVSAWRNEFGGLPSNGPSGDEQQTYAFTNKNAKFLAIDMYDTKNVIGIGTGFKESSLPQSWINSQIASSTSEQLFVYGHEPMYGRNHDDGYTGSARSNFLNSISAGGAGLYISGHDHQHSRSAITDSTGKILVQQLVMAPAGEKHYGYNAPSDPNDHEINHLTGQSGYYITRVEGPKVTVTLYATPNTSSAFTVADRFSYFSNGVQYLVDVGGSYGNKSTSIAAGAGYVGTSAALLGGINSDKTEVLAMGWRTADNFIDSVHTDWSVVSDVLEICGLEKSLTNDATDLFTLQLTIDPTLFDSDLRLAWFDDTAGLWTLAGNTFIRDSYSPLYGLGSFGYDAASHSLWAVVDHQGAFAAVQVPEPAIITLLMIGGSFFSLRRRAGRVA